ncbi:unnamed protein product [Callosobruchus maculatus]|uniref:HPS5-like beta-propeller domain-containing protein n=2 Tax=Callosobruchus maculatus TaxID=64391 RepID=A0A653C1V7_CALMS|nr:unnamed protein product [Callosobruchus maculatus]
MAFISDNSAIIREWAPLTDLFAKLPSKSQSGIFQQEIKLTCVDVLPEFIALGTNIGIVYWYDRKKKEMQRLRCENPNVPITSLKILSTVDYMVACGNNLGNISIFQIPKSHPESIPENLKPKNKQVERYTVTELHNAPISALEWSKNGMKLFSGDKNGCIVLTEIDFYMHICKSSEILNESYEVVQLSYNQQRLLVSTTYRSIICQQLDKWKVSQVGTKDRKILGKFGGIVFQHGYKLSDTYLYCTRPGLRIWVADVDGNVQKTLLFKELLTKECPEVPILNPISKNALSVKPHKEPSFGILLPFNDNLFVTYSNDVVYILDPQEMTVLCTINHLRSVLHLATHKDEIFVLEEERSLIRISHRPEPANANSMGNSALLTKSIKDITSKLHSANILPAIPPVMEDNLSGNVNIHTDETLVMNAEEAIESPVRTQRYDPEVKPKGNVVDTDDYDDKILFKKFRRRKKKSAMEASTTSISSNSSDEKDVNTYTQPTLMNLSSVGILPDLRSPESIKYDIEYKEKILADVLNLDKVKITATASRLQQRSESDCEGDKNEANGPFMERTVLQPTKTTNVEHRKVESELKLPETAKKPATSNLPSVKTVKKSETPALIHVPIDWKLNNLQLRDRINSAASDNDNSFSDWEIV